MIQRVSHLVLPRRSFRGVVGGMLSLALLIALDQAAVAAGAAPVLPDDPRLAPVRQKLEDAIARASAAGLPSELLSGKVREGLAKGVDAARIEAAVFRLAESLEAARGFVSARRQGAAPVALVRAVAEARMSGVSLAAIEGLVGGQQPETPARRAIEVLTDLSMRGYPIERAAIIVRAVLLR